MSVHYTGKDDARREKIRALWADGVSGPDIAERLGLTRNQVAGQLRRAGLYGANRPVSERLAAEIAGMKAEAEKKEAAAVEIVRTTRRVVVRKPSASDDVITAIETLRANQCRWVIGDV